jgi:hypothetical protein
MLQVTTAPALFPAFDPGISDYVVRADSAATAQVTVTVPAGMRVSVDGQPEKSESFSTSVSLSEGKQFTISTASGEGDATTYHVRCLPSDFPLWTAERPGVPQAEWYLLAPSLSLSSPKIQNYAILFDNHGVPVWWFRSGWTPYDVNYLSDGNVSWTTTMPFEEHRWDGSLANVISAAEGTNDNHELRLLPNGNDLLIGQRLRGPEDLSAYGLSPVATILDNVVEEIAPDGSLVWSWDAMDHIPLSETDPARWASALSSDPVDPYHMNSVEWDGDGYVVSLRHLDSIFKIDKATGGIVWKLGGAPHSESLAFANDPYNNFGGQHDARILPDGTLTVHDNGTGRNRPPRAARYRIDPLARTATLVEQVTDPDAPTSFCCGDARKLPEGDWVMSWGGNPSVTEMTPAGDRIFRLTFDGYFAYRANPLPFGVLDRALLRNGMDDQFAHPTQAALTTVSVSSQQNPSDEGASVLLSATVRSSDDQTPVGSVQFMADGSGLGDPSPLDETGTATLVTTALSPGSHAITALYSGDRHFVGGTSGAVTQVIKAECLPGDANADHLLTVEDAVLVLKAAVHLTVLTDDQIRNADVNRDGRTDIADAIRILRAVAQLEPLPASCE